MKNQLSAIKDEALKELASISSEDALKTWHTTYLGRKQGKIGEILKGLKDLSNEEKKEVGPLANQIKVALTEAHEAKMSELQDASLHIDTTLPPIKQKQGHSHLINQTIEEITDIFKKIGFNRVRHPEIDSDYYAFESLNIPEGHPARDDWETFFITEEDADGERIVLTPHTSNGQVREMEKRTLPIRMIGIGKTYRRQASVRHTQMFHQFEGLYVDKNVSIQHLKGTMNHFAKQFFGENRETRLRPFDFRFTEPSFEIDINCGLCLGSGCKFCKGGWVELGGSGMVHPNVLKAGGIDPEVYNGFAFGWGVERVALMREGINIPDIRDLYRNDLRFLEQF